MLKYHILRDNNVYKEEWVPERASFNTIYPANDNDVSLLVGSGNVP